MNENVENLILVQLCEMRGDMAKVRADIARIQSDIGGIRTDMSQVDQKVDGLTVLLGLLAGHVHHVEERVQTLEEKVT